MPAGRRQWPTGADATLPRPGLGADPCADHHGLFRIAAGVHHAGRGRSGEDPGGPGEDPPLHPGQARRRTALEPFHALPPAGGGRHPHRALRHLAHRPPEVHLPQGLGRALRQDHAVHCRHPLQLFPARGALAAAQAGRRRSAERPRVPVGALHRDDPQLPPL
ncbi:hypothetical protein D9M71_541180 [compost metagenome]